MKASLQIETIDKLIKTYRTLIEHEEQTLSMIESGAYFHRNNIVDITQETLVFTKETLDALRMGIQIMERARAGLIKQS